MTSITYKEADSYCRKEAIIEAFKYGLNFMPLIDGHTGIEEAYYKAESLYNALMNEFIIKEDN